MYQEEMNPLQCPFCNARLDGVTNLVGDGGPGPGDISLCEHCAEWLVFDKDTESDDQMMLRKPNDEESQYVATNVECLYVRSALIERHLRDSSAHAEVEIEK